MSVRPKASAIWNRLRQPFSFWQFSLIQGLTLTGLIMATRALGLFQGVELKTLDLFLKWRPQEPVDERILIVGINEADIQHMGTYPVPDQELSNLLNKLDHYQPRAVGIDIIRDIPVEPGHQVFVEALTDLPYVFGVESLPISSEAINPPPSLSEDRVGFANLPLDNDGAVRRSLLGTFDSVGEFKFSLTIRLASAYLSQEQIALENGIRDPGALRFGNVEIPRFHRNTGGYVTSDSGGEQTLLNVRNNGQAFHQVSMQDVLNGAVEPSWIRDRIILIGITSVSEKDFVRSEAIPNRNPSQIYGVELQAHAISQILSAVLDNRPLLRTWPEMVEYFWIAAWGLLCYGIIRWKLNFLRYFILVSGLGLALIILSYGFLLLGVWLRIVPALAALLLSSLVSRNIFQFYDRMLQVQLEAQKMAIRKAYNAIHGGPLQSLNLILQNSEQIPDWPQVVEDLHLLNDEIRQVYDNLENEIGANAHELHLFTEGDILELKSSMRELLHEVYSQTITYSPFRNLGSIKLKIIKFEEIQDEYLTIDQKRRLCLCLQEALTNVGKHAKDATRLTVSCTSNTEENIILIEDNGKGGDRQSSHAKVSLGGRGTQEARNLADQLGGQLLFQAMSPRGMRFELRWPTRPHLFIGIRKFFAFSKQ